MGGVVSCLPRYGCCVPKSAPDTCKENHTTYTSTPRANGACNGYGNGSIGATSKKKKHCRNLSAAFNMADLEFTAVSGPGGGGDGFGVADTTADLLNVNVATEEELMTLPGINRHTAHNIVEYRKQIGAFKKVGYYFWYIESYFISSKSM
jgi:DNA uptake protein ComE-like DNA-binding protein